MYVFFSSQFLTSRYADQILYILLDKLVAKHWICSLDTEQRNSLSSPPRAAVRCGSRGLNTATVRGWYQNWERTGHHAERDIPAHPTNQNLHL